MTSARAAWYPPFRDPGPDHSMPVITMEQQLAEREAAQARVAAKRAARMAHPFATREHECISEVFASYDMTPAQLGQAWCGIVARWHATSGRFYAYPAAHEFAAMASRAITPA
jgi:hypothetical protein